MSESHPHGPDNAEHEIRKAYNQVIEASLTYFFDRRPIHGVNPDETLTMYKHAMRLLRNGNRLGAERWARAAKHLSRAFAAEAKIAYLEPRAAELPFLKGAAADEFDLKDRSDLTLDLLASVAEHVPPGLDVMPEEMLRYIGRARKHLLMLDEPDYTHELLRAERIKAAHEYGRVLECLALAYEAEPVADEAGPLSGEPAA